MWKDIVNIIQILFLLAFEFFKYKVQLQSHNNYIINVFNYLSKKNIIYIKILQWDVYKMFSDNKVINDYTKTFCSHAPYDNEDIDFEVIHKIKQYAIEKDRLLHINDFEPINSGTIALVFKGTLDNKPIVIKILRKNIHNKIQAGIESIYNIVSIITFISSFFGQRNNTALNAIDSNKAMLLRQTNFLEEIKNIELFQEITSYYESIIVPRVYKEFTTEISRDFIIMEFIEGHTLEKVVDSSVVLKHKKQLDKFILDMYTCHHAIHCDLHVGNIILTSNDKICLIDFGLVIVLNQREKKLIMDLLFSLKNSNYKRCLLTIAKLMSSDKQYITDFTEKFNSLDINKVIIKKNTVIESAVFVNIIQIIQKVEIPKDSNVYVILLSLVSCFSLIEKLKDNTKGNDFVLRDYFSEFI